MIAAGNYQGAVSKLQNDLAMKVDQWLIDVPPSDGEATKTDIREAIEAMVTSLERLLSGNDGEGEGALAGGNNLERYPLIASTP